MTEPAKPGILDRFRARYPWFDHVMRAQERYQDSKGDFYAFTRGLIDRNRAKGDINTADWLAALNRASGKPALSGAIRTLLDKGAADPKAAIAALLRDSGITFATSADGTPTV